MIAGERERPEEAVRQWCAYELMRAYGISISELEFERQAKVGSKAYRIDIVVSRRGIPWVVVECKEPDHKKSSEGMAQAISYADAQEIQATFAVYTNGTVWHVKRRVSEQWVAVPDLPLNIADPASEPITDLLRGLQVLAPLLHKLDKPIEGRDAQRFMNAMQRFFLGTNLLTSDADRELLFATDNLLRVLSVDPSDTHYRIGKLNTARSSFEIYRTKKDLGYEILPTSAQETIRSEMHQLHASLLNMIESTQDLIGCDLLTLRLNIALLEYGQLLEGSKQAYPQVGQNLHHALRDFLNYAMAIHLNANLPDPLDDITVGDMRDYCHSAWVSFDADDRIAFREIVSALISSILRRLRFWENP